MLKILSGLVIPVALLIIGLLIMNTFTVPVSKSAIQTRVAARLPLTIETRGTTVKIEMLDIDTQADGRVRLNGAGVVSGFGVDGDATFVGTSGLRYEGGQVFLTDLDIDDVSFKPKVTDPAALIIGALGMFQNAQKGEGSSGFSGDMMKAQARAIADRLSGSTPIYTLPETGLKAKIAKNAVQGVVVTEDGFDVSVSARCAIKALLGGTCTTP